MDISQDNIRLYQTVTQVAKPLPKKVLDLDFILDFQRENGREVSNTFKLHVALEKCFK